MKILFYETMILKSNQTPSALLNILNESIEKRKKLFIFDTKHAPFRGSISGNKFKIYRIIHYQNSFLPFINGEIISNDSESKIILKISMRVGQYLFIILWYILALSILFSNIEKFDFWFLYSLIFLFIPLFAFWFEVKKFKEIFLKLVDA